MEGYNMKRFFKELKYRFFAKSPKFWKRVRNFAGSIATGALAIIITDRQLSLGIDPQIVSICGYIVAAGAAMGISAQMTTTNNPTDEKTDDRA